MRRVVITGMGLVTPLANGREASWKKLIAGESGLKTVDLFDTSDLACKIGGQVPWISGRGGGKAGGAERGGAALARADPDDGGAMQFQHGRGTAGESDVQAAAGGASGVQHDRGANKLVTTRLGLLAQSLATEDEHIGCALKKSAKSGVGSRIALAATRQHDRGLARWRRSGAENLRHHLRPAEGRRFNIDHHDIRMQRAGFLHRLAEISGAVDELY